MANLQAGVGAVAVALEKVYDDPQLLVEKDSLLDKLIAETGRAEKVGVKSFRLPFEDALPGPVQAVYLDNASVNLPAPGSSEWVQGTLSPVAWCAPIGWTKLAEIAGKPDNSVLNVVAHQMSRTLDRVRQMRDMMLCAGDGTGYLGTITAVDGANSILTLQSTDFGTRLLVKNQGIDVYNGTTYVTNITVTANTGAQGAAQTIKVSSTASISAGYIVRVAGLTSGSPQFVYGIPYWQSNALTGFTIGLDRSDPNNIFIVANGVNASNSSITTPLLRQPFDQIKNALGVDVVKKAQLKIHTTPGQIAAYEGLAGPLMSIVRSDGKAGGFDLLFDTDNATVNGVEKMENIHAHMQRWDILNPARWGKVKWGNPPFWFDSDGRKVFQQIGTNGQPTSGASSFLVDTVNYYVDNVKAGSSVYAVKQPTGY